ncbi:isopenicillin N synthase family dioxygenase [Oceanibaculum pacificum]|uniref:2-oxoglutarate-dependent ethylene/succinate-forming enzyme n=1 Tax=Oceanibaculum pacificum TaxID=580166 RepID=A0A154WEY1_9PROT|nr:2-oxoglutarate and iron-dependent oxygenase domain-containing protein [Oceanibaculum pacificum]KZD12070.1 2OG-Fe(II) oxygenase [Oceanibaculum pacificum]
MQPLLQVPVIDIAPFRTGGAAEKRKVTQLVDQACTDIGFLVISGHGVPQALIDEIDAVSRLFFDLPVAEKLAVKRPAPDVTRGYIPLEAESVARSRGEENAPGDLNESLMIGPVDVTDAPYYTAEAAGRHFHPNLWPAQPAGLRDVYTRYYRAMSDLAVVLMRIFALALDMPERFFDDKVDRHISRLRVRNYPAPETLPKPGQLRVGAHSDYGSLTILKTEANPGGLQVINKAGAWVDVPIVPSTFVINLGELMARWTNDRWVSTLHRVINPPMDKAAGSRRQSIVFFHNPNYDAEIRCIDSCVADGVAAKYPVTTSGDHLRNQFVRTQAM